MFLKVCILFAALCGGLPCSRGAAPTENFPHNRKLSSVFTLYWKVVGDTITFEVHAKWVAGGWVAIGFSETGKMFPADIAIGMDAPDGSFQFLDGKNEAYQKPTIDSKQDYFLDSNSNVGSERVFKFHRKLDTKDHNDVVITDAVMHLIWAYGDGNPAEHNSPLYHGATQRGTMDINFLDNGLAAGK